MPELTNDVNNGGVHLHFQTLTGLQCLRLMDFKFLVMMGIFKYSFFPPYTRKQAVRNPISYSENSGRKPDTPQLLSTCVGTTSAKRHISKSNMAAAMRASCLLSLFVMKEWNMIGSLDWRKHWNAVLSCGKQVTGHWSPYLQCQKPVIISHSALISLRFDNTGTCANKTQ